MEGRVVKSFYRVTKSYPPTDIDYQTRFDREGPAPDDVSAQVKESWDAYSAFDTPEGAIAMARRFKRLGRYICQYDVPEGGGITWEQTIAPGHYDLRGDSDFLKRCLVGCVEEL